MAHRRTLTEAEVRDQPWSVWNAFVDLLAQSDAEDLDPRQRPAHLVFWYDSEVQNGGHFQYFENRGLSQVHDTVEALKLLGAHSQSEILSRSLKVASQRQWGEVASAEEFVSETLESDLCDFDAEYNECAPSVSDLLERHVTEHRDWYITIVAE